LSVGTLENFAYTYDPVGNITQIQDAVTSETQAFGYDARDRLTSATVTNGPAPYSESYTYNPTTGNLASKGEAPTGPSNPGTGGLAAWWSLNETSGTRNDSHSTNHLTDNNTVGYAAGKQGNAANLELNNSEFLERVDNASLSTGNIDFSLSAWVKLESKSDGSQMVIISRQNGSSVREYKLYYTGSANDRFAFQLYNSSGTAICTVWANNLGAVSTGTWYFINAWHEAAANTGSIQVNDGTPNSANETAGENGGGRIVPHCFIIVSARAPKITVNASSLGLFLRP